MEGGKGDFTSSEAARFLGETTDPNVIAPQGVELRHHLPDDSTGLSASVFFDKSANRYVLGIRGTAGALDGLEDLNRIGVQGFAGDQFVSLYRYYRKLTTPTGQQVSYSDSEISLLQSIRSSVFVSSPSLIFDFARTGTLRSQLALDKGLLPLTGSGPSVIPPGAPLIVTGHSLGGHLALLFGRFFPDVTDQVVTYNAPGIGPQGEFALRVMGIPPNQPSRVTNVAAAMGTEAISRIWSKPGESVGVFTESGNLASQHPIVPLADSLALYGALAVLSPDLATNQTAIGEILSAASPHPENSLESALDDLRAVLGGGEPPTLIASNLSDLAAREDYYENLYRLLDGHEAGRDYQIESLVGKTPSELASMAASDISVRYALRELNPFTARGADYSEFGDSLSGQWLASRAEMLAAVLDGNLADRTFGFSGTTDNILFRDIDADLRYSKLDGIQGNLAVQISGLADRGRLQQFLDNTNYNRTMVFGSESPDAGDSIVGLPGGDRLFGGAGDDVLDGAGGDDYLEGGSGSDTLIGGTGNDTLDGGEGVDRLEGGAGKDTYVFVERLDADTIVDRDGLVYAGSTLLTGGTGKDGEPYVSSDGRFSYTFTGDLTAGGTLIVNGALRIEDFRNGDLGIHLSGEAERTAIISPVSGATFLGDFAYARDDSDVGGDGQTLLIDVFGNPLPQARREATPDSNDSEVFQGTPGNDTFILGGGDDFVQDRFGGDDHIDLGEGADIGFGGEGNDLIEGGAGRDVLIGGRGNDTLVASRRETVDEDLADPVDPDFEGFVGDWLAGGDGDDTVLGDAGGNFIEGGAGRDRIFGGAGSDTIVADRVTQNLIYEEIYDEPLSVGSGTMPASRLSFQRRPPSSAGLALTGTDVPPVPITFQTVAIADVGGMDGDADFVDAGAGNDVIVAGGGDDLVFGGTGDDSIWAGTGTDAIYAGDGADFVRTDGPGDGGLDYVDGGLGDDVLEVAAGDDAVLFGGEGNDELYSEDGNDFLIGGAGDDFLNVLGGGSDLDGGSGDDLLTVFNATGAPTNVHWGRGSGSDFAFFSGGATVIAATGVLPEELSVSLAEREMGGVVVSGAQFRAPGGEDVLFIFGWPDASDRTILSVEFSDGTVWDDAFIRSLLAPVDTGSPQPSLITGSGAADVLYGTSGADTLSAGAGDDWLIGGKGDDTYSYAAGDGFDEIQDIDATAGNTDSLVFASGIAPSDVEVFTSGQDYILAIGDGGVRLRGGRTVDGSVERIEFSDGTLWGAVDLEGRAEALPDNRSPQAVASFGKVSVDPGSGMSFSVPQGAIEDPDRFDSLKYYAITADGERLPDWLHFDEAALTISGTPTAQESGKHEVLLIAVDQSGAAALSSLTIEVAGDAGPPADVPSEPPIHDPVETPLAVGVPARSVGETSAAIDPPPMPSVIGSVPRRNEFADDVPVVASNSRSRQAGVPLDPLYREMQQRLDVLLQTGRANLGERYAEAVREFEERRTRKEAPLPRRPTDEEAEVWNGAMHNWHERNPGFSEADLDTNDGSWTMGWGLPGASHRSLDGAGNVGTLPGLASPNSTSRLTGAGAPPALSEGLQDLR